MCEICIINTFNETSSLGAKLTRCQQLFEHSRIVSYPHCLQEHAPFHQHIRSPHEAPPSCILVDSHCNDHISSWDGSMHAFLIVGGCWEMKLDSTQPSNLYQDQSATINNNSHGIQPPLPILQLLGHLKLILRILHFNPTAMKTHAS